ncbi:NUDIX domain-containing protein [Candidatus Woesearchaeota archaeon]|nr:NUDIX domain-containing protein [Candidatus Woesearchaeota archaeon]
MIINAPEKIDILNIGCIITYNNKYLLVHMKKEDKWKNISGKFEDEDKSINLSIKRKINEEVGLNIEPSFFIVTYHKIKDKNIAYYLFKYNFSFDPSDSIKLNDENDKFGFFSFEETLKLKLFEDEDYCLKLYNKNLNEN